MPARQRRYWDSNCFLGWLAREPDKVDRCRAVIRAAEKGEVVIVTSSLTLTEVIKLKKKTALPREKEALVRAFFKHEYIEVRLLDRRTAEFARDLVWTHGVPPKDAIHLATALLSNVVQMDTFDNDDLIRHSGKLGDPPLVIGYPNLPVQSELFEQWEDEVEEDEVPGEEAT